MKKFIFATIAAIVAIVLSSFTNSGESDVNVIIDLNSQQYSIVDNAGNLLEGSRPVTDRKELAHFSVTEVDNSTVHMYLTEICGVSVPYGVDAFIDNKGTISMATTEYNHPYIKRACNSLLKYSKANDVHVIIVK